MVTLRYLIIAAGVVVMVRKLSRRGTGAWSSTFTDRRALLVGVVAGAYPLLFSVGPTGLVGTAVVVVVSWALATAFVHRYWPS